MEAEYASRFRSLSRSNGEAESGGAGSESSSACTIGGNYERTCMDVYERQRRRQSSVICFGRDENRLTRIRFDCCRGVSTCCCVKFNLFAGGLFEPSRCPCAVSLASASSWVNVRAHGRDG